MSRNRQKIRDYETNLYATNPEHAKDIIAEKNKRAFLFVGGMLTGGSGKLFMMFTDGLFAYSFYEVGKGILKKDAKSVNEGVKDATIAATGDLGGWLLGRLYTVIVKEVVPVFRGTTEGWPGLASHQKIGVTPTSSNPAVATAFATEAAQTNGGSGVIYIADASVLPIVESNVLANSEREIAIGMNPSEFAQKAPLSITLEQSRTILKGMGINVPSNITKSNLTYTCENLPKMTPSQIKTYVQEALKVAKINK